MLAEDAAFIARSRTLLPELAAALRASEARAAEADAECHPAREALGCGVDDSRWRPGETAVQAIVREHGEARAEVRDAGLSQWAERDAALAEMERLRARLDAIERGGGFGCHICGRHITGDRCVVRPEDCACAAEIERLRARENA